MSSSSPPSAAGQHAHDDRGPAIIAVHWSLTALATIFLGLRVYCKHITKRRLWWDDWILIAAWTTIITTDVLTTVMVYEFKLGRHSDELVIPDITRFLLILSSRATTTITATVLTKTAFAITLLRLTAGRIKQFVWFIIVSMNIAMGFSAAVPWIQCQPLDKGWIPDRPGTCWATQVGTKIWIATGAYSALMDFTLAILPWTFLYNLLLQRKEKIGVLVAMSMGVIAGAVAIVKCAKLPQLGSGDAYNETELYMWDIAESTVTMMAACIPTLRVLLRDVKPSSSHQGVSTYAFSLKRSRTGGFHDVERAHQFTESRISDNKVSSGSGSGY
ncbi:hypothetical protein QBC47DRAFT_321507 [Echria macrotheca]|uniref:Rhodopsin domain-containing protein n=1 Tax=Echria macrotheca TaxID=438768 RepID=A0AAJ0F615_9PEZI|nr:hypothetical protein QBC47DRAFT_321507 [Echria macrotheca]